MTPDALLRALGSGTASVAVVNALRSGQLKKRLLMLRMALSSAPAELGGAYGLLARLEGLDRSTVRDVLLHPSVEIWLDSRLRRTSDPVQSSPGRLGALAATATILIGTPRTVPAAVEGGRVLLPGLGLARIDGPDGEASCEVLSFRRFRLRHGAATAEPGDGWSLLLVLAGNVQLDDLDPLLGGTELTVAERDRWPSLFDDVLASLPPAVLDPLMAWLTVLVPSPGSGGGPFGSLRVDPAVTAPDLASALVRGLRRSTLEALTDLVDLVVHAPDQLLEVPWSEEPQSPERLLADCYARLLSTGGDQEEARWGLDLLSRSSLLTDEGAGLVSLLRAPSRFVPSPSLRPRLANLTGPLLAAYADLRASDGPLHACVLADLGRRLLTGASLPPYQMETPVWMRPAIERECSTFPVLADPRQLPPRARTAEWGLLCANLGTWAYLTALERARTARVLTQLGFWRVLTTLERKSRRSSGKAVGERDLALMICRAKTKCGTRNAALVIEERKALTDIANDQETEFPARIRAAANLIVLESRIGRYSAAERWCHRSDSLMREAGSEAGDPILASTLLRAQALPRYACGDHVAVGNVLDEAERHARAAFSPRKESPLLALENIHLLLETRARSARGAGDHEKALHYCQQLTEIDPLDSKVYIELAEYLLMCNDLESAHAAYQRAVLLGAPYASYARWRAREQPSITRSR